LAAKSLTSPATSSRALLLAVRVCRLGYLPKFARAADGRDPALIV